MFTEPGNTIRQTLKCHFWKKRQKNLTTYIFLNLRTEPLWRNHTLTHHKSSADRDISSCVCVGACIPLRYKRKKYQRKCDWSKRHKKENKHCWVNMTETCLLGVTRRSCVFQAAVSRRFQMFTFWCFKCEPWIGQLTPKLSISGFSAISLCECMSTEVTSKEIYACEAGNCVGVWLKRSVWKHCTFLLCMVEPHD